VNQGIFDGTGTSAAAYATLFTNTNSQGVIGIGAIKNTDGVNSLRVKETVIDAFGATTSKETDLGPGDNYLLDPQTFFDAGKPRYSSYKVEVKDTVAASHATWEAHYTGLGTVS
jgi:hypothetical protein